MIAVRLLGLTIASVAVTAWAQTGVPEHTAPLAEARNEGSITPLPEALALDQKKVSLGEKLFHDRRLSGDNSRACADCHPLAKGAMDGEARGLATDGQRRLRNTLTLYNVVFNGFYNWDGRTSTLEEHGEKLLTNTSVMNGNFPDILGRLRQDAEYPKLFATAFTTGLTPTNIVQALAEFERSLITPNARFDHYLRTGQGLSAEEEHGYQLFKSYGCIACHQGINIGGNLLQRFGIFRDPNELNAPNGAEDVGRFAVTSVERDRGVFRVPSLRNVVLTAPYFHDGRVANLATAVATMAQVQLGRDLNDEDLRAIVSFLGTLTGELRQAPTTSAKGE
jgi:cytochrome c peroxidase